MNNSMLAASMIEAEARDAIKNADSLEDKLKAAFNVARNHWMFTDENTQFSGGVGAVMVSVGPEHEYFARLETELKMLRGLNALLSGIPVDISQIVPEGFEAVGLNNIWHEVKEAA